MTNNEKCDNCIHQSTIVQDGCLQCIHFATLDNFEVKQDKIIDMNCMVGSNIDMEFTDTGVFDSIGKLVGVYENKYAKTKYTNTWSKCRIRQDHWHSWQGVENPLPEGLVIGYSTFDNQSRRWVNNCSHYIELDWSTIYEFKVLGPAKGWKYEP